LDERRKYKGENMAEAILGIDFGTTNSVMAWYDEKAGRPQVISNAEGEEKTPSVVYYIAVDHKMVRDVYRH
jgi:molecular chaperone DnaK (HSP70)